MSRVRSSSGQASVELVVLLPLVAVLAAVLWQAALAGHAVWVAGTAARAAARAHAVGGDAVLSARRTLPPRLGRTARVITASDGAVSVRVRIPSVIGGSRTLASFTTRARLMPPEG